MLETNSIIGDGSASVFVCRLLMNTYDYVHVALAH